jgi:hypothetical protein
MGIAGQEPAAVGLLAVYRDSMTGELRRFPAQGKQWGQGGLYELFERIANRAGLSNLSRFVHNLRHYFATALSEQASILALLRSSLDTRT